jgi:hypothetical protein
METSPVKTPYGIIYGRNALLIKEYKVNLTPMSVTISCALSLGCCKPVVLDMPDVDITFAFKNVQYISIYKLDHFPYETDTSSNVDKFDEDEDHDRYILSTYDHVFDIAGDLEITGQDRDNPWQVK